MVHVFFFLYYLLLRYLYIDQKTRGITIYTISLCSNRDCNVIRARYYYRFSYSQNVIFYENKTHTAPIADHTYIRVAIAAVVPTVGFQFTYYKSDGITTI